MSRDRARRPAIGTARWGALGGAFGVVIAACASGCDGPAPAGSGASATASAGPQERWTEIASEVAPLLKSPTERMPPPDMIHRGELVRMGPAAIVAAWDGELEGEHGERDGMLYNVQRASMGARTYAFQSDLGREVAIGSTEGLCDTLANRGSFNVTMCPSNLHRARAADGAVVSYLPCGSGACPLALERDGKVAAMALESLTAAMFFTGKKKSVVVAQTRWVKDEGKRSGGALVVVALDGAEPVRVAEFATDEVDARDTEHIAARSVTVAVSRGAIRITGTWNERAVDGRVLASKPIDETHALPPLD